MTDTPRIDRRLELEGTPIDRVWSAWTEAGHLGRWLSDAGATIDLREGGDLTLTWADDWTLRGVVDVVEDQKELVLRLGATRDTPPAPGDETALAVTLTEHAGTTWVTVLVTGFAGFEDPKAAHAYATEAWRHELHELTTYLQLW